MIDPVAQNTSVKRAILTEVSRLRDVRETVRPSEKAQAVEIDKEVTLLTAAYEIPSIPVLIAAVRDADKAYNAFAGGSDEERKAWRVKNDARRALREGIYNATGVNIDDLRQLAQG